MTKETKNILRLLACLLSASLIMVGCATVQGLTSTPPYKSITVHEPFKWGDGVLTVKVQLPAGKYVATYEDSNGYYYQAPNKIAVRDSFYSRLTEGGLFLRNGTKTPKEAYFLNQYDVPVRVDIGDRAKITMNK
ncbi:MAG: hypothetical protein AAGA18_08290 [Verrucomicrobiota bacterium]